MGGRRLLEAEESLWEWMTASKRLGIFDLLSALKENVQRKEEMSRALISGEICLWPYLWKDSEAQVLTMTCFCLRLGLVSIALRQSLKAAGHEEGEFSAISILYHRR